MFSGIWPSENFSAPILLRVQAQISCHICPFIGKKIQAGVYCLIVIKRLGLL
jgi:hypothetical protein